MLKTTLLILLITFCIFSILITLVSWFAHISMTTNHCKIYGWGSYKEFVEQFQQHDLQRYNRYSIRDNIHNNQFANSIIKFQNKGMLLYPIAWLRANLYVYITTKQHSRKFRDL